MKVYNIFIGSILVLLGLSSCTFNKPVKIECDSLEEIETIIKNKFNSDEVNFESKWLKEEIYFKGLNSLSIFIINPTTKILDFKSLSQDKYHRFDNYEEIENKLKIEGRFIYDKMISECKLEEFNQVVIVFAKRKSDGSLFYRFGNVYEV